jgi:hypothetical protein
MLFAPPRPKVLKNLKGVKLGQKPAVLYGENFTAAFCCPVNIFPIFVAMKGIGSTIYMKTIKFILIILLLQLSSCYCFEYYEKEKNKCGIIKTKSGYRLSTKREKPFGSYATDGKIVQYIDLSLLNDTISKRCFSSYELENLKNIFLQDSLYTSYKTRTTIYIEAYDRSADMAQCVGLFYADVPFGYRSLKIPLIKLNDTTLVNGLSGIEADSSTREYIETSLLEVYDSVETKKRVDIFMKGRDLRIHGYR